MTTEDRIRHSMHQVETIVKMQPIQIFPWRWFMRDTNIGAKFQIGFLWYHISEYSVLSIQYLTYQTSGTLSLIILSATGRQSLIE